MRILILALISLATSATAQTAEIDCLTKTVYHEARSEPTTCQHQVAKVVLNRLSHKNYPTSICKVVYQKHQFSWTAKEPDVKEMTAWIKSRQVAKTEYAKYILNNRQGSKLIYFTQGKTFKGTEITDKCGKHIFMKEI